jgi:hypothetical protein
LERIALIAYGDGGELGSFRVFADNLSRELQGKYQKMTVEHVTRDFKLFQLIDAVNPASEQIGEMHIFSHSIGAGLFLGYKDPTLVSARRALVQSATARNARVTFVQSLRLEIGALTTDDLLHGDYANKGNQYSVKFASDAFLKIWGCNSGVEGWVYSDAGVTDPADASVDYYWRSFNEVGAPKPSFAATLARYLGRTVYGAKSGASVQVKYKQNWVSTKQYRQLVGHWPSGALPHRLVPDKGSYQAFSP